MTPTSESRVADTMPQAHRAGRFFRHPEPEGRGGRIWPVFLTYKGCGGRCVFCAQHLQSGRQPRPLSRLLAEMTAGIEAAGRAGREPYELAFYGGVFTALPAPWPERFLAEALRLRQAGLVTRVRCSTRPDACDPARLARLAAAGLDMVELGAQTFDDAVLAEARRGHDAAATRQAARAVRDAGLALGLQLLPGLPGHTPEALARDAAEAAALSPEIVRLHPCLVVAGTALADRYQAGRYVPWDLDATLEALAGVLPVLWRAGARVARIGLAPEPALSAAILAGPRHPALGSRVRARALCALVAGEIRAMAGPPAGLVAPRRFSGQFFGHGLELAPCYRSLGLDPSTVRFEIREDFCLISRVV